MTPTRKHLISLADLSDADLRRIVARGVEHVKGVATGEPLSGTVLGVYFRKTSTRTRTAFSSAALRLGARIISYGPDDLQLNTGETIEDTAEVMSRMLDGLVARTAGTTEELRALAAQDRMSVVNAMSAREHPTQALADLTTMAAHFGSVDGLRVLYLGEGNNTAAALALGLTRYPGTELHLRTPAGFGLEPEILVQAKHYAAQSGSLISERHDVLDLPSPVDVVYTTRWQTTGTSKNDPDWRTIFAPFHVDESVLATSPGAVFMHDLPAHRGEEVSAGVLDGPRSIAFDQAEAKFHSAKAVLEWCIA
ncbi:ornithine carbamoyltransferase [Allokutzneria sp. A3M-2-11 16]|uniref:ornithine carbamoyltransferase n=1 Tax=Allokutzneria sp. A3M-2-11 16 TaxID=2962043 RepID=UPI0020B6B48A|nr:ornithine carbamoyltransferase [Allokutzneria sp. A3M-2-11 16]MCP3804554.1 ornithine carbamoyltransferase [Allokutzneria sp. A3M-2-11 16]